MSFSSGLVNTVSINRPTTTFGVGGKSVKTYAVVSTGTACNIQSTMSQKDNFSRDTGGYEFQSEWMAFFEYGIDIQKDDKIVDERSRTFIVQSAPEDMVGRMHHIEVGLAKEE